MSLIRSPPVKIINILKNKLAQKSDSLFVASSWEDETRELKENKKHGCRQLDKTHTTKLVIQENYAYV